MVETLSEKKYNRKVLQIFRSILIIGTIFLFMGILNYVFLTAETMSMVGVNTIVYKRLLDLYTCFGIFGIVCIILGLIVSLIIEKQRLKFESVNKSIKINFLKDIFLRYFTLLVASLVFYIPCGFLMFCLPENFIKINPLFYACLVSEMAFVLFKEINAKYNSSLQK